MKFKQSRRGVSAVEFAMTLPILLALVFGAYEISRANMMMHTIEAACYEGARLGIVPGATPEECIAATQLVLGTAGIRNAQITVTPENLRNESDNISVSVTASFRDNTVLAPFFMGDGQFERSCVLTREKL